MSDQDYVYYWHKIYDVWRGMLSRCFDEDNIGYYNYGERGITVCEKWRYDFVSFYVDSFESFAMYVKDNDELPSIDRINNNGGYFPFNCRWTDLNEQYWNSRRSTTHEDINRTPKVIRYPFKNYSFGARYKFSNYILTNTTKKLR